MHIKIDESHSFSVNGKKFIGAFEINSGGVTLITGINGVGKSSLFEFLKINKQSFFGKKNISFLDQSKLSPLNNVSLNQTVKNLIPFREQELDEFIWWLDKIQDVSDRPLSDWSGGQNQMAKIALCLFIGGDYFFFDEPLHFLDKKNKKLFLTLLQSLIAKEKRIVLVEHQSESLLGLVKNKYEIFNESDQIGVRLVN
jgi:ABC-type Mn2+/Zn2+ transport system ATPase subunit